MNFTKNLNLTIVIIFVSIMSCTKSNETLVDKISDQKNEVVNNIESTYKNAKNEICEMVNGKLECAKERIKEEVKNIINK